MPDISALIRRIEQHAAKSPSNYSIARKNQLALVEEWKRLRAIEAAARYAYPWHDDTSREYMALVKALERGQ